MIGAALLYFGVDLLRRRPRRGRTPTASALDVRAAVVSGALIGLLGGLVGLILGTCACRRCCAGSARCPRARSAPTSPSASGSGLAGVVGHLPGGVDWTALGAGAAASVPGALVGARLTGRMSEQQLLRGIGGILVVAGTATALQALL